MAGTWGSDSGDIDLNQVSSSPATIIPTELASDPTQGGADFSYQVLYEPGYNTEVALYWSSTPQFSGAIGGSLDSMAIATGTAAGTYGPFNVPQLELTPPPGANYVLAVTDPTDVLGNFDPNKSVLALATTSTAAASTSTPFGTASQTVPLSATVTSAAGTVDEGTETFTILSGATVIGSAVNVNVENGSASASYVLPAATSAGTYTIQAVYNGTADFLSSTDTSHSLTVSPATTSTAAASTSTPFSTVSQTVPLSSTVTSAAGTVDAGTETFTILSGATVIGSAVTVNVENGSASANYILPAGTPIGTYTIQAVYNGTAAFLGSSDTSHTLTVIPPATQVVITGAPVTVVAGLRGGPITVQLEDADGNPAVSAIAQTIALSTNSAFGVFYDSAGNAITSVTIPAGQVDASFYYSDTLAGNPTVTASISDGTLDSSSMQQETVTPAVAVQVAIVSAPLDLIAGTGGAFTVELEDADGNPGATSAKPQTINLSTTSTLGGFVPTSSVGATITSVTIPAGKSSATVYYVDDQAGAPTLTASDTGFTTLAATQDETISPAAVAYFTVATSYASPDPAGTAGTVTVTAYDTYDNPVSSGSNLFEGTVDLSSTDPGESGLPSSYTFTAADAGSHTFNNVILETAGNQTITATYSGHPSITGTGAPADVVPGPVDLVAIAGPSGPVVAGTSDNAITVQLEDAYDNTGATSSSAQVIKLSTTSTAGAFYASSTGGGPITAITIPAGQGSVTVYYRDTLAGLPTLTASDSALTTPAAQEPVSIVPAAAGLVAITTAPLSFVAGGQGEMTVQLEDAYHNRGAVSTADQTIDLATTSADGAFSLSSTGGAPITSVVIPAGQSLADFYYSDTRAGTPTVTASDGALDSSSMQQETVTPDVAVKVAIVSAPLDLIAGTSGAVTVELEDADGNPGATSAKAQTIELSTTSSLGGFVPTSSGGAPITSVTIPAGQTSATVFYGDDQAGTPTLTASDSALSTPAATQQETIDPSETTHLVVTTGFSSPAVAGTASTVTVTAEDQYDNVVGSGPDQYEGTVELNCTDGQESGLPATYTFTPADDGSHSFAGVILETAGSQTITATDSITSTISGGATVDVVPAAASQLVFTTPPPDPISAGQPFTVVVTAEDPYGNADTSFDGRLTISMPGEPGFTTTVQAQDGIATLTGLTVDANAQGQPIQVAGDGLATASTTPINVTSLPNNNNTTGSSNPPPTITGEQVVMSRKTNKKGKPVGKAILQGFTLAFSTAMNAQAAGSSANYTVAAASIKRIKKKKMIVFAPVAFTPSYNAATHSVTLTLAGKPTFAKGGQITVDSSPPNGVSGASGIALAPDDATFTIQPRAKGITPG